MKKLVNETIAGIVIDSRKTERISEAFGWPHERYAKVGQTMHAFGRFQQAVEELHEDLPRSTIVSLLADFLKSDSWKKLGIQLKTPNDYLMIGYVFSDVVSQSRTNSSETPDVEGEGVFHMPGGGKMPTAREIEKVLEEAFGGTGKVVIKKVRSKK